MARTSEINTFSGGMNTVVAPYLLAQDESVMLVNVDIRRGSLWSMPQRYKVEGEAVNAGFFYQFNGSIRTYSSWRSNVLWNNTWYWSDGAYIKKMLPDFTEKTLGLATPTLAPTVAVVTATTGALKGELKYCYTYYDNNTGVESAPSPLSAYYIFDDDNATITISGSLPTGATHFRIYRVGGYLPFFALVGKTTSTAYTDNKDDTQIEGTQLQTLRNGAPPSSMHYLTEMNGRMYGALGNNIYYSALGNPDSWYIFDAIPCQGTIVGLAKMQGGLMVFGKDWCNILKGSAPSNFVLRTISDKIGMSAMSSLAYIDQNAIWLGNHGIIISDGYSITQLTSDKISSIQGLAPTGAMSLNNVYYLSYRPALYPKEFTLFPSAKLYPARVAGTSGVAQGVISVDFKRGQGYAYRIIEEHQAAYISKLDGYVGIITGIGNVSVFYSCDEVAFPSCSNYIPCDGWELSYLDKQDVATGANVAIEELAQIEYISPTYIDGTTTTLKEYDKARVTYKGDFVISILFDNDRVVVTRNISSNSSEFATAIIGIPNSDNKSYSIRFIVQGIGIINGIQWSFNYRELP